ncbi:MAG TPA: hypothetical protein VN493_17295 [Thermoanaerobaculia bacterium]|nr:hypothetical protein [Thermoanaerobaculia bacterium]
MTSCWSTARFIPRWTTAGNTTPEMRSSFEEEPQSGAYDVLELDRDELVGKLRRLAEWTQAVTVNPDLYVLHLGI